MTYYFNNVYFKDKYLVGGLLEYEGPYGMYLNEVYNKKEDSFEDIEINMVKKVLDYFKDKTKIVIGGDLSNQLANFYYAIKDYDFNPIGVYSACSTMNLSIVLASILVESNKHNEILCVTSSCNQSAERQFRFPNEYGGEKYDTQTFTSTIASGVVLSNSVGDVRVSCATLGKVIDIDYKNACDFGRVMAPAAIECLFTHLKEVNKTPSDYDLILTGDLSAYGSKIVKEELEKVYGTINNYNDCGLMIYDINKQKVFAGGSGPGTSAFIMLGYIYDEIKRKKLKRVLLCATGALMNQNMVAQKRSIPGICHVVELEVV